MKKVTLIILAIAALMMVAPSQAAAPITKRVAKLEKQVKSLQKQVRTYKAAANKNVASFNAELSQAQDARVQGDDAVVGQMRAERTSALEELRNQMRALEAQVDGQAGQIANLTQRAETAERQLACLNRVIAVNADDAGLHMVGVHAGPLGSHPAISGDFLLVGSTC